MGKETKQTSAPASGESRSPEKRVRPRGGYRHLRSFQIATMIYDATYWFCERFLDPRSRMNDQMIQAARSGRQNIAEASRAAATSSQTELRLMNVARSSLEELLLDFEDYLRHRREDQWPLDGPEALAVRNIGRNSPRNSKNPSNPSDPTQLTDQQRYAQYAPWLDHEYPAIRANALICLIHQANYLLDLQIDALEKQFIQEGGYSEQLAAARLAERERRKKDQSDPSDPTDRIPTCPKCGNPMLLRTAQKGKNAGNQFWGCVKYPDCKGAIDI